MSKANTLLVMCMSFLTVEHSESSQCGALTYVQSISCHTGWANW